jgi:hypothetical protein
VELCNQHFLLILKTQRNEFFENRHFMLKILINLKGIVNKTIVTDERHIKNYDISENFKNLFTKKKILMCSECKCPQSAFTLETTVFFFDFEP